MVADPTIPLKLASEAQPGQDWVVCAQPERRHLKSKSIWGRNRTFSSVLVGWIEMPGSIGRTEHPGALTVAGSLVPKPLPILSWGSLACCVFASPTLITFLGGSRTGCSGLKSELPCLAPPLARFAPPLGPGS